MRKMVSTQMCSRFSTMCRGRNVRSPAGDQPRGASSVRQSLLSAALPNRSPMRLHRRSSNPRMPAGFVEPVPRSGARNMWQTPTACARPKIEMVLTQRRGALQMSRRSTICPPNQTPQKKLAPDGGSPATEERNDEYAATKLRLMVARSISWHVRRYRQSGIAEVLVNHGYRVQGVYLKVDQDPQTVLVESCATVLKGSRPRTIKGPRYLISPRSNGQTPNLMRARGRRCHRARAQRCWQMLMRFGNQHRRCPEPTAKDNHDNDGGPNSGSKGARNRLS